MPKNPFQLQFLEEDVLRKFNPLLEDHPMVGKDICPGCGQLFKAGDVTCLVMIGPGDDVEEQQRCREGRAYNGVAVPAHWTCATGENP